MNALFLTAPKTKGLRALGTGSPPGLLSTMESYQAPRKKVLLPLLPSKA